MVLTSSQFNVRHGFSTRGGGVSEGPFASLNLGRSVGDDPERVEENGRRFAAAVGLTAGQFVAANQVHGDRILEIDVDQAAAAAKAVRGAVSDDRRGMPPAIGDADGLVTRARGVALAIRTADCVPVLLWAPDVAAIGAVHAGWRGALAAIARRGVERMAERYGAQPGKLRAVIGPSIRRCCYEVGASIAESFERRFGEGVVLSGTAAPSSPHLDLVEANRRALLEAGVAPENIEALPHCTCCEPESFFSHRRDQGRTGRHLAFIAL